MPYTCTGQYSNSIKQQHTTPHTHATKTTTNSGHLVASRSKNERVAKTTIHAWTKTRMHTQKQNTRRELTHGAAAHDIDAVRGPVGVGDLGVRGDGDALAVHAEGIFVILEIHLALPAAVTVTR